ncbi:MAG: tail fiber protein [Fimbriimonadaceae bacterium]|nr:tail fiber protein [Fimbriimonadaceae bacterium]
MKRLMLGVGLAVGAWLLVHPQPASSQGVEAMVGEIRLVPYGFAPEGWAFCEGQMLPLAQNQALYSLIGAKWGGNATTQFALPDLREAEKALAAKNGEGKARYIIALSGVYPTRP